MFSLGHLVEVPNGVGTTREFLKIVRHQYNAYIRH